MPVVVADLQGGAGLVDGATDPGEAEDLEVEVEVPGPDPDLAEQPLAGRSSWWTPLWSGDDDPARELGGPRSRGMILEIDQLGRVAAAVERPPDEADQVVLDQRLRSWRTPRARASPGPSRSGPRR